jgi:hypothetical protein
MLGLGIFFIILALLLVLLSMTCVSAPSDDGWGLVFFVIFLMVTAGAFGCFTNIAWHEGYDKCEKENGSLILAEQKGYVKGQIDAYRSIVKSETTKEDESGQ